MPAEQTAGAALRWGRAAALTCVVLGFSAVAHAAAGGALPGPVGMGVLAVPTAAVLAALLGRQASTLRVVALVAGGQAALHAALTAAGGHPTGVSAAVAPQTFRLPEGRLAEALGADQLALRVTTGPSRLDAAIHHLVEDLSVAQTWGMTAAHLAAAALLGWWLAAGERLAWRLVVLLTGSADAALVRVRVLLDVPTPPTLPPTSHVRPSSVPRRPAPLDLLSRAVVRRGPPVPS